MTSSNKAFNLNDVSSITTINKRPNATNSNCSNTITTATAATTATTTTTTATASHVQSSLKKYNPKHNSNLNLAGYATPKTLTTPTRFIPAKPAVAKSTMQQAATTTATTTTHKRVNFDLPTTIAEAEHESDNDCDNDDDSSANINASMNSMALAKSKHLSLRKPTHISKPHIIFNGTYPIDMPLASGAAAAAAAPHAQQYQQLCRSYDAEANADRADMQRYRYMLHDYIIDEDAEGEQAEELLDDELLGYDDDDDEQDDDDDEDDDDDDDDDDYVDDVDYMLQSNNDFLTKFGIIKPAQQSKNRDQCMPAQNCWSMQELIANPSIPLNYKKMCNEVEQSLSKFEAYLDAKNQATTTSTLNVVRTYDIDEPAYAGNPKNTAAGLAATSSKKQL